MRAKPVWALFLGWTTGVSGCYATRTYSAVPPAGEEVTVHFRAGRTLEFKSDSVGTTVTDPKTIEGVMTVSGRVLRTDGQAIVMRVAGANTSSRWIDDVGNTVTRIDVSLPGVQTTSTNLNKGATVTLILAIPLTLIGLLLLALNAPCAGGVGCG